MAAFDPKPHLITVRRQQYLSVAHRIMWFRAVHPRGTIETEIFSVTSDTAVVRCVVRGNDGILLAAAHGSAVNDADASWAGRALEKAETAAVGRALALAGFGTQFALGFDEGDHLADAPVAATQSAEPPSPTRAAPQRVVNAGELRRWFDEMVDQFGVTPELVRDALGVASALEWTGTLEEATERIREYVNAQRDEEEGDVDAS